MSYSLTTTTRTLFQRQLFLAGIYSMPLAVYAFILALPRDTAAPNAWVRIMLSLGTLLIAHAATLLTAAGIMQVRKQADHRDDFMLAALCLILLGVPGCFLLSWLGITVFGR